MRPPLSFLIFFGVFSTLVGLVHYYIWIRLFRSPGWEPNIVRAGGWVIGALAILLPVGLILSRVLPREVGKPIALTVYAWFGFVVLAMFSLFGSELLRIAASVGGRFGLWTFDEQRRTFLAQGIAGVVGLWMVGGGLYGLASALGDVRVERVRVPLSRFPAKQDGFKLVQLTDVHIGPTIGGEWLRGIVDKVNALEPDAIAITGDLVDGPVDKLRDHVAPLADLKAKHGVFFVTGNHEYYSGVDRWIEELGRLGIRVLRNERVSIGDDTDSFDLAGVDDWASTRFGNGHGPDLAKALEGRDKSRELILLAHQPKQAPDAADAGVGLQLSGHTHGGQIFPWNWLVRIDQPFVRGLSKLRDMAIYVSCGTGYWGPPMRVGAPAEITVLELSRA